MQNTFGCSLPVINVRTYIKIFDGMVLPILLYGVEAWGPYIYDVDKYVDVGQLLTDFSSIVEKLHSKFCKHVLLVHKKASNIAVWTEMGRYPLIINITRQVCNYYINICNRNSKHIICHIMHIQKLLYGAQRKYSWFKFLQYVSECTSWKVVRIINKPFSCYIDVQMGLQEKYRMLLPHLL